MASDRNHDWLKQFNNGRTQKDIAQEFGITQGAVSAAINKARRSLRGISNTWTPQSQFYEFEKERGRDG